MRKIERTLMCILLVAVFVVGFASPAFALHEPYDEDFGYKLSTNGSSYKYTWKITGSTSSGKVSMTYPGPDQLKCIVTNRIYNELNDQYGSAIETGYGYGSASATEGNIYVKDGYKFEGTVTRVNGQYYIHGDLVEETNLE